MTQNNATSPPHSNHAVEDFELKPGVVVRMRRRLWRVDQVNDSTVTATPLDGRETGSRRFVRALEDIGPASMPFPSTESVSYIANQDLLLDAYRVSLIHGSAPILGLQRSRAVPTEYQLVPLLKTIGKQRARLLIADDVGTGKTVEAGLVLAELLARGQARRVLVAVPANLREQWAEALDHFFHLPSTIVAGHLLPGLERRLLPGQSVWEAHDVVVASIDYLKKRPEHVFAHPWDIVIIDEAHLAGRPHQQSPSESDMQRWRFALRASQEARHLMLLTATPHNGYHDSYASLFELVDPALVTRRDDDVTINRERAKDHVVQRRRADIEAWYETHEQRSPFPTVDQDEVIVSPSRELARMLNAITEYSDLLYEQSGQQRVNGWIAAHLQKRALSSPHALRQSLKRRLTALERRAAVESTTAAIRDARDHVADSLAGDDGSDEERSSQVDVTASTLRIEAEIEIARATLQAASITPTQDSKLRTLLEVLGGAKGLTGGRLREHPDRQRVIVFTRFKDTLDYVASQLRKDAASSARTAILPNDLDVFEIYGDMTLRERREEFARFERSPKAVLVATDCISEGLNLQQHCAELIHYEVPYNPSRLSQRNGRISRYGQPEPTVGIRLLVVDDPLDQGLMELVVRKAQAMYHDYGFVPDFLANPDILYYLSHDSNRARHLKRPSLFDILDDPDVDLTRYVDPFDPEQMTNIVQQSFYGQEDVSLGEVQRTLDKTRAILGGPERLLAFLNLGLNYYNIAMGSNDGGRTFRLEGSNPELDDLLEPDARYTLDPQIGMGDPDVDIIDLSHRLVRRLVDLTTDRANLPNCEGRIAGSHTPDVDTVTGLCHILARYVAHADPPVLLEELVPVSIPVYGSHDVPEGHTLEKATPGYGQRSTKEVADDAIAALERDDLTDRIITAVEARRSAIATSHADIDAPWSAGLERVETASWDLTAITVLYPETR